MRTPKCKLLTVRPAQIVWRYSGHVDYVHFSMTTQYYGVIFAIQFVHGNDLKTSNLLLCYVAKESIIYRFLFVLVEILMSFMHENGVKMN